MGLFNMLGIFKEKYQGGLPNFKAPQDLTIQFLAEKVEISNDDVFFKKKITLQPRNVIEVKLDQQKFRSAGGAALGTVVGGILTGGIGAIAGAAIGGRRQNENNLLLVLELEGRNYEVHFSPSKTIQTVYSKFVTFASKAPVVNRATTAEMRPSSEATDIPTQLEKLYTLVGKGILTQEEFETQKKKLLS